MACNEIDFTRNQDNILILLLNSSCCPSLEKKRRNISKIGRKISKRKNSKKSSLSYAKERD